MLATPYARCLTLLALLALPGVAWVQVGDEPDKPDEASQIDTSRVSPVLNVGGHSGPVQRMVFGAAGKRLYTVGLPGELQEWDADSGERLRVWRFPAGADRVAISPDGKLIAVGGQSLPGKQDSKPQAPVWMVDATTGQASLHGMVDGSNVHDLAFSPKGDRLAVNAGLGTMIFPVPAGAARPEARKTGTVFSLAFGPDGSHLLTTRAAAKSAAQARIFDLKSVEKPHTFPQLNGARPLAALSPNGERLAVIAGGATPAFLVQSASGKARPAAWSVDHKELHLLLGKKAKDEALWHTVGVAFRSENEVVACWEQGDLAHVLRFDLNQQKAVRVPMRIPHLSHLPGMALSRDGRLLALAANPSNLIAVADLEEGKLRKYPGGELKMRADFMGPHIARPAIVGWTKDGDGIVWGNVRGLKKSRQDVLHFGLNLKTLKPIPSDKCIEAGGDHLPSGWQVVLAEGGGSATLVKPGAKVALHLKDIEPELTRSFKDSSGKVRLLVAHGAAKRLAIVDPGTGNVLKHVGKQFFPDL